MKPTIEELKPCPFCGKIPKLCKHIESIGPYIIHDMQDEKQTVCPLARSSYSLDEWNTRAAPDHTELLRDALEALNLAKEKNAQASIHIAELKQEHVMSNYKLFAKSLTSDTGACIRQAIIKLNAALGETK